MSIRTSRSSKRLIAAAVAVAVTASTFAISNNAGATASTTSPGATRLSGDTRFETAGAVAADLCKTGGNPASFAIVNGRNFPDGIAVSALGSIVLLTETNELPDGTVAALNAAVAGCGISALRVIGGTSAVSATVLDALKTWADTKANVPAPVRVSGEDRYGTALAIAALATNESTVVLATGDNFPDALTAGVIADAGAHPLLLTSGTSLPAAVKAFINTNATKVIIVGGTSAVPASIATELNAMNKQVVRLGGADRAATAVAIADYLETNGGGTFGGVTGVTIVNGWDFADAIAASRYAASKNVPVLLTQAGSIPAATAAWHVANADTIANLYVVGGTSAVSASVATGAVAAATAAPATITGASLAISQSAQASVTVAASATASATAITLTAVKGGAADGAAGNAWSVDISTNTALALSSPVKITVTNSATTKAISIEGKAATDLTAKAVVDAWNASAAGALFTAAKDAAIGNTEEIDLAVASTSFAGGTTKATVVVTYSRDDVTLGAANLEIFKNTAATVALIGGSTATITPAAAVGAGAATLTAVWELTATTDVPVAGTAELRIAASTLNTVGLGTVNTLALIRVLTSA